MSSIFQVSFVFTNQVDGKLAPIDSTISPKLQAEESSKEPQKPKLKFKQNPIRFKERNLPSKVALKSSYSPKPSVFPALSSVKVNKNISTNAAPNVENSCVNQLPQKRSCPVYVDVDSE